MISRLGKCRLAKWYSPTTLPDRQRIVKDMTSLVLNRKSPSNAAGTNKLSNSTNIVEYRDTRVIYKKYFDSYSMPMTLLSIPFHPLCRYASLWFIGGIGMHDNALLALETLHRLVETLDKYFGNVEMHPFISYLLLDCVGVRVGFDIQL